MRIAAGLTAAVLAVSMMGGAVAGKAEKIQVYNRETAIEAAGRTAETLDFAWWYNYDMEEEVRVWPCGDNWLVMTFPYDNPILMFVVNENGNPLLFRSDVWADENRKVDPNEAKALVSYFAKELWPGMTVEDIHPTPVDNDCVVSALIGEEHCLFSISVESGNIILENYQTESVQLFETMPDEAVRHFAQELTNRFDIDWENVRVDISMTEDGYWLTTGKIRRDEIDTECAIALDKAFGYTENGWMLQQLTGIDNDEIHPLELKRMLTIAETKDSNYWATGVGIPTSIEWQETFCAVEDNAGQQHGLQLTILNKLDVSELKEESNLTNPAPDSISLQEAISAAYRVLEAEGFDDEGWQNSCILYGYSTWNHVDEGPAWQLYIYFNGYYDPDSEENFELYIDAETGEVLECMLPGSSNG